MGERFEWNEARHAELTGLLNDRKTAAQIGAHFGVSRDVIIGKVWRDATLPRLQSGSRSNTSGACRGKAPQLPKTVSLPGGAKAKARTVADKRMGEDQHLISRIRSRQNFERGDFAPPVVAGYKPERWREGFEGQVARVKSVAHMAPHHCKFPIDLSGGGVGFCGASREAHSPYCTDHALRCFNPTSNAGRLRLAQSARS